MNAVFEKHWDALVTTAESTSALSLPAVRLALHLAIRDAHEAGREMWCADDNPPPQIKALELNIALGEVDKLSQERNTWRSLAEGLQADVASLHQRLATALEKCDSQALRMVRLEAMVADQPGYEEQQNRLMRWLIDNEPEASLACDADEGVAGAIIDILDKQRQVIANYDTALSHAQNEAAMLRQERADLQAHLDGVQRAQDENRQEIQLLRRELAQAAANAANGASPDPTPTPDWGPSHPAWQGLTAEEQETIAKLAAGTIKFRGVIKARRLILIGQVLRHIGSGNSKLTMAQYDYQRPSWMPEATSITQYVESKKWQDVVGTALTCTATQ